ncbi:unnamed protein product [Amaranthus hypochondriacus]
MVLLQAPIIPSRPTFTITTNSMSSFPLSRVSLDSNPRPLLPGRLSACPQTYSNPLCANQMNEVLEIKLKVRDYELNQYGVVNNSVYCNYIQLANHELARRIGLDDRVIEESGGAALSKLSLTYLSPLKNGEEFVINSIISDISAARLYVDHFLYKLHDYQPILEAKAVLVLIDKNNRPVRVPAEVKSKAKKFMKEENSK